MVSCEVINIGTELLLGDILNTNSRFLSVELAKLGIDLYYHISVGDNKVRIMDTIKNSLYRSNILIITGGLGPTPDDITVESIAELFKEDLISDDKIVEDLKRFYTKVNRPIPESAYRQALKPKTAQLLSNDVGTAPALFYDLSKIPAKQSLIANDSPKVILAFPGVPSELYYLWNKYAISILKEYSHKVILSDNLKHYGLTESALAELYNDHLACPNPTMATYAKEGECELKVTIKADNLATAQNQIDLIKEMVKAKSGQFYYGNNNDTLESVLANLLIKQNLSLSIAESCTGGLVSSKITKIDGISQVFKAGIVSYSNEAKMNLLHVNPDTLNNYGAVSKQCAEEMAIGVAKSTNTQIGLAITGIAGPTGESLGKNIGLVYFALYHNNEVNSFKINFLPSLTRSQIQERSAKEALNIVRIYCLNLNNGNKHANS